MENLRFNGAIPVLQSIIVDLCPELIKKYNFWILDNGSMLNVFNNVKRTFEEPIINVDYEIIPILTLENLIETNFNIGDYFTVKGVTFKIITEYEAISLNSIGSCPVEEELSPSEIYGVPYETSQLKTLIDDWYLNFFAKESVCNILDIYNILPMKEHTGRYEIVNWDGVVRHNASGHGFMSIEKATRMLKNYAAKNPIPEEDIAAYEIHRALLIEMLFPH